MPRHLPRGASEVHEIWPDGPPENPCAGLTEKVFENPWGKPPERWIRNVQTPRLTRFPATGGTGATLLVIPGGAFHFISIDNEGYRVARRLAAEGIEAFVLTYRCHPMPEDDAEVPEFLDRLFGSMPPVAPGEITPQNRLPAAEVGRGYAEEDGRQAMRFLRENAQVLGIDADRIGVIGFSAGGGIAAHLAFSAPADCRPAFAAPIYAGYRTSDHPAPGAPPTFLAVAADDPIVPAFSIARLAETCHRATVPVTLHVYGNGGHGFGMRTQDTLSDRWFDDFTAWLADFDVQR